MRSIYKMFIIIAFTCSAVFASAPSHLKWISAYEYVPESAEGWCNFGVNGDTGVSKAVYSSTKGIAGFVVTDTVFYQWVTGNATRTRPQLRSDYQKRWEAFSETIKPLVQAGYIKGFYLLDEAIWGGLSKTELETQANTIKTTFPNAIIIYVEGNISTTNVFGEAVTYSIPVSADWIGIDEYKNFSSCQTAYNTKIFPNLQSNQKAILIPPGFADEATDLATQDQALLSTINQYYNWAVSDANIIGFMFYHWYDRWADQGVVLDYGIGLKSLPLSRARVEEIGKDVVANNSQTYLAEPNSSLFVSDFDAFSNGESLPSTYASSSPWLVGAVEPNISKVCFSTEQAASGNASIKMITSDAVFHYEPGSTLHTWCSSNYAKSVTTFKVYISNIADVNLVVSPVRATAGAAVNITINSSGMMLSNWNPNYNKTIAGPDEFKTGWNTVEVIIDYGDDYNGYQNGRDDDYIIVKINGNMIYSDYYILESSYLEYAYEYDLVNVSFQIKFAGGPCYIDDIGIWSEPETTSWRVPVNHKLESNLVRVFHFDEGYGTSTSVSDNNSFVADTAAFSSSYCPTWGTHGVSTSTQPQRITHELSDALKFNGEGSTITTTNADYSLTNDMTVSFWIQPDTNNLSSSTQRIIQVGTNSQCWYVDLVPDTDEDMDLDGDYVVPDSASLVWGYKSNGTAYENPLSTHFMCGYSYYVTLTRDVNSSTGKSTLTGYINSAQDNQVTFATVPDAETTGTLTVGNFTGLLDEIAIYNTVKVPEAEHVNLLEPGRRAASGAVGLIAGDYWIQTSGTNNYQRFYMQTKTDITSFDVPEGASSILDAGLPLNFDKCLLFSGTRGLTLWNAPDDIAYYDFLNGTFGVAAWVKLNSMPASGYTSFIATTGDGYSWSLAVTPTGKLQYKHMDTTGVRRTAESDITNSSSQITTGEWMHIAFQRFVNLADTTTTIKFYVNGQAVGQTVLSNIPKTNYGTKIMIMGYDPANSGNTGWCLNGYLDDIRYTSVPVNYQSPFEADSCELDVYKTADLNKDCYVNFDDLLIFINKWLFDN